MAAMESWLRKVIDAIELEEAMACKKQHAAVARLALIAEAEGSARVAPGAPDADVVTARPSDVKRVVSRRLAEYVAPVAAHIWTTTEVKDLAVALAAADADGRRMVTDSSVSSPKNQQVLNTSDQQTEETSSSCASMSVSAILGLQGLVLRRSEAAYGIMLLVTRHNTWALHPKIYKMIDGFIPFRFLLKLRASRAIRPPPGSKIFLECRGNRSTLRSAQVGVENG